MKKKQIIFFGSFLFLIIVLTFLSIYLRSNRLIKTEDISSIEKYITSYTNIIIPKHASINIEFSDHFIASIDKNIDLKTVLKIYPSVKGEVYWLNDNTIEYNPYDNLESNSKYSVKLSLNKLTSENIEPRFFIFEVQTIKQEFSVKIYGLQSAGKKTLKWQKLSGKIQFADSEDIENVKKIITVKERKLYSQINIKKEDNNAFYFEIDSIQRLEESYNLEITFNGSRIDSDNIIKTEIEIPALGDFKFHNVMIVHHPEQYIRLQFTDPLEQDQLLSGLIRLDNKSDLKFIIKDNLIEIYPPERLKGNYSLIVEEGIKNILGYNTKNKIIQDLFFEEIKPAVRFTKSGSILPNTSGKILLPFEAVNLKAIDLQITRIYENNIRQFFQDNNYDGNYRIKYVGNHVIQKTITLEHPGIIDYGNWNRFTLDLSELINEQDGAIYKIDIGFRKNHSVFNCNEAHSSINNEYENDDNHWDTFDYYWYGEYSWEHQDNPCHDAFYGSRRIVSKNILLSDIGIIVKKQNNDSLQIIVNDVITTNSIQGSEILAYNFQQQLIHTSKTNNNGFAFIPSDDVYFISAKYNNQITYLKLSDASALPLSNFDVSGANLKKGLKGYIFGERGVWRPGDTLFISFLLQENAGKLPENHPIIYQLYNPHNQLVYKTTKFKNSDNFYVFKTPTQEDFITGIYNAKISVGSVIFRKNIRIETIRPNRLKIKLEFNNSLIQNNEKIIANFQINWLHGSPANKLNTRVEYFLKTIKPDFSNYKDFVFHDLTKSYDRYNQLFYEGLTNENGILKIEAKINIGNEAPGFMNAIFTTKVFEKGGSFSIDQETFPFHPYKSYLGIKIKDHKDDYQMLLTDTNHNVEFVVVDIYGKKLITENEIDIKVYKLTWRWWWDNSYDNIANYEGRIHQKPIQSSTIITKNGKGHWKFRVNYPEWGRFLIKATDKNSGHSVSRIIYMDWPGWFSRENKNFPQGANMLSFTTDKEVYKINEKINLTFPSGAGGRALISIENGTKVLKSYWVDTEKEQTQFNFIAKPDMCPNIFIHVSLIQPHNQTTNSLPIRMYGILPIKIENEESKLSPQLIMPDKIRAETIFDLEVKEESGQNMTYIIAIVDEGILDLTKFKTPNPWNYFYAREAIGVKTWDTYDWIIGAYGSEIGRLLSIGGDDEMSANETKKVNRFKPIVKFIGPIMLESGMTNKHSIKLPPYIGSVRTMLIAKNNEAYGIVEKTSRVTKPLMLLASLPRVLGPEEIVRMQVDLFALSDKIKKVDLEIITNDLLKCTDKSVKTILINSIGEKTSFFNLKVNKQTGIASIEIIATSGIEQANYKIDIDIRNPNPPITNVISKVLVENEKWQTTFSPLGIIGTNSGKLEVSSVPAVNLEKRIKYLIRYPFGCIEQTTSVAFPLLYLENMVELTKEEEEYFEEKIQAAILKIRTFQKENGGFTFWPGSQNIDSWCTSYAGHFLIEAQNKGFVIPHGIIAKWINYQQRTAQKWTDDGLRSQLMQAYRLYTLSLAGKPTISALNHLREKPNLNTDAKWRLAAAYKLAGKNNIAEKLVKNLSTQINPYTENYYTYGSDTRDKALILETLILLEKKTEAFNLIAEISKKLSSNSWLSTQELAYSLLAISKYYEKLHKSEKVEFAYNINKGKNTNISTNSIIFQTDIPMQFTLDKIIQITNKSEDLLHASIILSGIPSTNKSRDYKNDMTIEVNYNLLDGTIINPVKLEQGVDFIVEVKVKYLGNNKSKQQFALEHIFPSGWEIFNYRLFENNTNNQDNFDYQDVRDDRVLTYFSLHKGESKTFKTQLNSGYIGKYYLPAIKVEAMYNATINASKAGKWIEVVPKQ